MVLKLQQDEHRQREAELKQDKRSVKLELKELELAHEDVRDRKLKQEHDKNIAKLRQEYERNVKELQHKYKIRQIFFQMSLRHKGVIHANQRRNAGAITF